MRYIAFLLCLVAFSTAFSQTPQPNQPQTLQQQYNSLKPDMEVINGFRMVKMYSMDQLWKSVDDSLRAKQSRINQGIVLAKKQTVEINQLKKAIVKTEKEKQALVSGVANITVLGGSYSKAGFVTFVTCVVIGLIVLCAVLFVISKVAYKSSRDLKKVNEEVYKEFEDYKHQAVEKQIKLSRELQNLKNRMSELKIA